MAQVAFLVGVAAAIPLVLLLLATWAGVGDRIWPTPEPGSWQSLVFWPLFRILNVSAFATAATSQSDLLTVPGLRLAGLVLLLAAGAAYLYALHVLGRANTYCSREGLVTHGIYRWTRNPQYATVIPVYVGLALLADNGPVLALCASLILVYVLMALTEEPWLAGAYGAQYHRYCQRVPRFFNWRRALVLGHTVLRQMGRQAFVRLALHGQNGPNAVGTGRKRI